MSMLTVTEKNGRVLTVADYEARIEIYKEQIGTGYIGIGKTLIEAKESGAVAHGEWEPWVERVTGLTMRQAQRCMQAAREIREGSAMARLEMSKAILLLQSGLDEETREEIAGRAGAEGATVRQLRQEITEAREKLRAQEQESAEAVRALKGQLVQSTGAAAEIRQALKKAEQERDQVAAQMRASQQGWQARMDEEAGRAYKRGADEGRVAAEKDAARKVQARLVELQAACDKAQAQVAEARRKLTESEGQMAAEKAAKAGVQGRLKELQAEADARAEMVTRLEQEAQALREDLEAAERREEKRSAQMAKMQEQIGQREMDAARGVRASLGGEMDLGAAVRRFLAEVGMLPQMGAMLSGIGESERAALRVHVDAVSAWARGAAAALETIGADGAVM